MSPGKADTIREPASADPAYLVGAAVLGARHLELHDAQLELGISRGLTEGVVALGHCSWCVNFLRARFLEWGCICGSVHVAGTFAQQHIGQRATWGGGAAGDPKLLRRGATDLRSRAARCGPFPAIGQAPSCTLFRVQRSAFPFWVTRPDFPDHAIGSFLRPGPRAVHSGSSILIFSTTGSFIAVPFSFSQFSQPRAVSFIYLHNAGSRAQSHRQTAKVAVGISTVPTSTVGWVFSKRIEVDEAALLMGFHELEV